MKAILLDYDCNFDTHRLSWLRRGQPDKFYKVTLEGRYPYCFAVYDVSMLESIGSGDGETFVSIRNGEKSICCDGVAFINDDEDAIEFMTKQYSEDVYSNSGNVSGNCQVEEIDLVAKREALEQKDKTVKRKIKATIKKMIKTKQLTPSRPLMLDKKTLFVDKEDEILALGSYVNNGVDGIRDYVIKKMGIDENSIRTFTIPEYDYPLVSICLPGNYYEQCRERNLVHYLDDCFKDVDCITPVRDYYHVDIDLCWKDVDFEFKDENAIVTTVHWRPDDMKKLESDRKDIEVIARKGFKMKKENDGNIGLYFPSGVKTVAASKIVTLISEILNEKFGDTDESLLKKEVKIYSKYIFTKIISI